MDNQTPVQSGATPAPPAAEKELKPASQPPVAQPAPAKQGKARVIGVIVLLVVLVVAAFWYVQSLGFVSTDDAYVNGHATFVAPRVGGQVAKVFVDDNNQVHKGDLLLQLDAEPYQTQVDIAQAGVTTAESDVVAAQAEARGSVGQIRSLRFNLERAIEDVDNQIALLRSKMAALQSARASLDKAQADYDRATPLAANHSISQEEFDLRKESLQVAHANVEEALQGVYQVRVSLGQPPKPDTGDDLTQVPADLDQTFSTVRQAQASLIQAAAALGVSDSLTKSPKQMIADFYKRDPQGDIDKIYDQLVKDAPILKQAEAKLAQAQRNLDQAQLNLKYCNIYAEIDGVVTRRNVNPGNNVIPGQSLMAIRSLTEIWIDANFKETQLASLRIGQSVKVEVDMYGRKQEFKGRISGFTIGTGSTLALLPAQNATGNFVKVVQRLPVRIDLIDYDPEKAPLFIGLSVEPRVDLDQAPTGPNAGKVLQPYMPTSSTPAVSETRP